jgi:ferritin
VNEVFEDERKVSALVLDLHAAAVQERDTASQVLLQWFVSEQVEEEARAQEIVEKLRIVGNRPGAALYLDSRSTASAASPLG